MHRFYISDTSLGEKNITVENIEIHHQISKVFRGKQWDRYIFFDGKISVDYEYEVQEISRTSLTFLLIGQKEKVFHEKGIRLYQWLPNKWEKIEYIVQKWVEVGIHEFHFFRSQLAQKLFVNDSKIERIKKIAIEAIEQSGRNIVPKICFYESRKEMFFWTEQKILFHHIFDVWVKSLKDCLFLDDVSIFVGPEGGWSPEEVMYFSSLNCQKVYFWEAILRCETVSSVSAFYIQQV